MKILIAHVTSLCSLWRERKKMKLAVFVLLVFLSAFITSGQETQTNKPDFGISGVKVPVRMEGLYQNRTNSAQRTRITDGAIVSALQFFKKTQNSDGSWGERDEQSLATPLILMSFLGRGEKATSQAFSNTVIHARTWLLNAAPTGTASRLATVISLSAYCDLSYLSSQPEQRTNEVAKMQILLNQVSPTNNDIWLDFAAFYTMPGDLSKPSWMRRTKETHERHLSSATNRSPLTVEEYLTMHMAGLAAFYRGGKSWYEFNRTSTTELIGRQQPDGSFPVSDGQSRFIATALATLRLEIHYQHEPKL